MLVTPDERRGEVPLEDIRSKVAELRDLMKESNDEAAEAVDVLKTASSSPGSSYYWLIFVILYAGVYFLQ